MMIRKLNKNILGLVIGIVALTLFVGTADAINLQSWDKKIDNKSRFVVLKDFDGEAVLDKETGLVWEKSPSTSTYTWVGALGHCYKLEAGGRKGWHLPTIDQLGSLVDTTNINPSLPTGHPFINVQSFYYWSAASTDAITSAKCVYFYDGDVSGCYKPSSSVHAWCVRGGQSHDAYY